MSDNTPDNRRPSRQVAVAMGVALAYLVAVRIGLGRAGFAG